MNTPSLTKTRHTGSGSLQAQSFNEQPSDEPIVEIKMTIARGVTGKPQNQTFFLEANQLVQFYFQGEDDGGFIRRQQYVMKVTKKGLALMKG